MFFSFPKFSEPILGANLDSYLVNTRGISSNIKLPVCETSDSFL
jgi:hypothetical protein